MSNMKAKQDIFLTAIQHTVKRHFVTCSPRVFIWTGSIRDGQRDFTVCFLWTSAVGEVAVDSFPLSPFAAVERRTLLQAADSKQGKGAIQRVLPGGISCKRTKYLQWFLYSFPQIFMVQASTLKYLTFNWNFDSVEEEYEHRLRYF